LILTTINQHLENTPAACGKPATSMDVRVLNNFIVEDVFGELGFEIGKKEPYDMIIV
jgi:hypothetical protein